MVQQREAGHPMVTKIENGLIINVCPDDLVKLLDWVDDAAGSVRYADLEAELHLLRKIHEWLSRQLEGVRHDLDA